VGEIIMAGYDKDFLVAVFMHKYIKSGVIAIETLCDMEENAYKLYDRVGKDKFREYAAVTPQAIKEYKNA
jgi:hypothetical protein